MTEARGHTSDVIDVKLRMPNDLRRARAYVYAPFVMHDKLVCDEIIDNGKARLDFAYRMRTWHHLSMDRCASNAWPWLTVT
jgi:hypothetical protein